MERTGPATTDLEAEVEKSSTGIEFGLSGERHDSTLARVHRSLLGHGISPNKALDTNA
jgi:hypothetical protein